MLFSKTQLVALVGAFATVTSASPVPDSGAGASGSAYNCGCSSRKSQLVGEGANSFDLAVGFQETGSKLSGTAYAYGDGKTEDSANFGMFKNNWYMIRTYCSQFHNQPQSAWHNGAALNSDDAAAIKCLHEQIAALGQDKWFAGQRYAQSGLQGQADQSSIQAYKTGVTTIQKYLDQGHLTDGMATSYDVAAV